MKSFLQSQKKHLLLTGSKKSGKTHLAQELCALLGYTETIPVPGITTRVIPHSHVVLTDHVTGESSVIGHFFPSFEHADHQMRPVQDGFLTFGIPVLKKAMASNSNWVLLDELGYLESNCSDFQNTVLELFQKKRTITVIRKESNAFLDTLRTDRDVYLFDLDKPLCSIGCVIMASGNGRRFGSNKLMTPFRGVPLISPILAATADPLFASRMVVTRHPEVKTLCQELSVPVLFHELSGQNDTIRLGLSALMHTCDLEGCLFVPGDQPLLSRESLEMILLSFSQQCLYGSESSSAIFRLAYMDSTTALPTYGSPVLFGSSYFSELLLLPEDRGGRYLITQYPHHVHPVYTTNAWELKDIDTPEDLKQLELES